jgi:hypothetical protein
VVSGNPLDGAEAALARKGKLLMINLRRIRLPIWSLLILVALAAVAFNQLRPPEPGITDLTLGTGPPVKPGDTITVHYTGRFVDGKLFDSSRTRSRPFRFTVGKRSVIAGWDTGLVGMQAGGIRRLIIPPSQAYGERGIPGAIPPKSTLAFDVELLTIE